MRKLFKRWYIWFGLVLLLGFTGSAVLIYSSRSRINQNNFDRIRQGMSEPELVVILGVPDPEYDGPHTGPSWSGATWSSGPNWITVSYVGGSVYGKTIHLASAWETLRWHVKKGAERLGVEWD